MRSPEPSNLRDGSGNFERLRAPSERAVSGKTARGSRQKGGRTGRALDAHSIAMSQIMPSGSQPLAQHCSKVRQLSPRIHEPKELQV